MEDRFRPLAPAARWFWALRVVIPLSLLTVVAVITLIVMKQFLIAVITVLASLALSFWWSWLTGRRFRAWGYAELDRELIIRHGVMIQRLSVVPYGRMQFIDVFQGPIDRMLKVATVKLHTAAAATDATIPFVEESEARRLRERLTELGESHAAGL